MIVELLGEAKKMGYVEFRLTAENDSDLEFISSMDMYGHYLYKKQIIRSPHPNRVGCHQSTGVVLSVDPESQQALDNEAGRKIVWGIRQLVSLLFGLVASNGHDSARKAREKSH